MFSPVEAFFLLSCTGMVYVLTLQRLSCCNRTHGWCMCLSCSGFLVVIVHRDGVCPLL